MLWVAGYRGAVFPSNHVDGAVMGIAGGKSRTIWIGAHVALAIVEIAGAGGICGAGGFASARGVDRARGAAGAAGARGAAGFAEAATAAHIFHEA